jgi:lysozyme family protein
MRYSIKWPEYAKQWDAMVINKPRIAECEVAATYAIEHLSIYREVEQHTGVPWALVWAIHRRESDAQDAAGNPLFTCYLGNGQPLVHKTTIEPIGRGPFREPNAFLNGCVDALHIDLLDQVKDWRLEKMLYYAELLNGPGSANRGLPSSYIWGGTNIQKPGKFIKDHKWVHNAIDKQLGVAPMLWTIAAKTGVSFVRES